MAAASAMLGATFPNGGGPMAASVLSPEIKLEPYWWEAVPRPAPRAELPAACDVAIVGSGFTGLSAALTLVRAGRRVVVLEAGALGQGASSRNGGMCGGMFKVAFSRLCARLGLARAAAIYKEGQAALDHLAGLIERERIDCHFARVGRFTGAHAPGRYEALARETELLRKHVGIEADMVPRGEQHREIGSEAYHGGRVLHRDGGLHPALYHQGLLERAVAAGAVVAADAPVTAIAPEGKGFTIATGRGKLAARDVIVATNGYTGRATPYFRRRLIPARSFIIATEPLAPEVMARLMPKRRMLTDTRKNVYYFRPSPDGRRILFGGRPTYGGADLRVAGARLHRFMTGVYPELAEVRVSHSWSGYIALTFDRLPHTGRQDGVHYALGYCGSGVVMATYLGHKTALRVLGDADAATPLDGRAFPTMALYTGTPWFVPAVALYYRIADRLAR